MRRGGIRGTRLSGFGFRSSFSCANESSREEGSCLFICRPLLETFGAEEEREAEEGSGASETSDADGPGLIVRLGVSRPELADAKEEARERWRWGVLGEACAE